jgi:hypothetical protein
MNESQKVQVWLEKTKKQFPLFMSMIKRAKFVKISVDKISETVIEYRYIVRIKGRRGGNTDYQTYLKIENPPLGKPRTDGVLTRMSKEIVSMDFLTPGELAIVSLWVMTPEKLT